MATPVENNSSVRTILHVTFKVAPEDVPLLLQGLQIIHGHVKTEPQFVDAKLFFNKDVQGILRVTEEWKGTAEWLREVLNTSAGAPR